MVLSTWSESWTSTMYEYKICISWMYFDLREIFKFTYQNSSRNDCKISNTHKRWIWLSADTIILFYNFPSSALGKKLWFFSSSNLGDSEQKFSFRRIKYRLMVNYDRYRSSTASFKFVFRKQKRKANSHFHLCKSLACEKLITTILINFLYKLEVEGINMRMKWENLTNAHTRSFTKW